MNRKRIEIPRTTEELVKLAKLILKRHKEDGKDSYLSRLPMDELSEILQESTDLVKEWDEIQRRSVLLSERLRTLAGIEKGQTTKTPHTLLFIITSARDVLLGHHKGHEKKLGLHGFKVKGPSASSSDNDEGEFDQSDFDDPSFDQHESGEAA